ncbi:MAG: hypothetical protein WCR52_03410 [Bacteroidota bacterium]
MRNEQLLVKARPLLNLDHPQTGPDEAFQNKTLRPILKMQHPLLLAAFEHYSEKRFQNFIGLPVEARGAWITESLRNDARLRNILTGMVIGQFTTAEFQEFTENRSEKMRRLLNLLSQRLESAYKK